MPKKRILRNPNASGRIPRQDLRKVVTGIHVLKQNDGWHVKSTGSSRPLMTFSKKPEAVAAAKKMGQTRNAQVIIHCKNGKISRIDTYGKYVPRASPAKRA